MSYLEKSGLTPHDSRSPTATSLRQFSVELTLSLYIGLARRQNLKSSSRESWGGIVIQTRDDRSSTWKMRRESGLVGMETANSLVMPIPGTTMIFRCSHLEQYMSEGFPAVKEAQGQFYIEIEL